MQSDQQRRKVPEEVNFFTEYGEGNRYQIEEVIGKGSYGVVCSAFDTHTGEKVAIKKINNIFEHVSDATRILREIKLLRLLRHPDIVEIKHILLPPSRREFKQVIKINDYQKSRFVNRIVSSMFNTVSGKKIAVLGFAFKKDTGDTRETPAIDVCKGLIGDRAQINIYDPQVTEDQIQRDLAMNKFDWDHPLHLQPMSPTAVKQVRVVWDAYEATKDAHGVCILTEWDEFKKLDFQKIYDNMQKPAFVFDGRNVVDAEKLREIGFIVYMIGKPLDAWLKDMPAMV